MVASAMVHIFCIIHRITDYTIVRLDFPYDWFAAQFEYEMFASEFRTTLIMERLIDNYSDWFRPMLDSSGEKVRIYKLPISIQAM